MCAPAFALSLQHAFYAYTRRGLSPLKSLPDVPLCVSTLYMNVSNATKYANKCYTFMVLSAFPNMDSCTNKAIREIRKKNTAETSSQVTSTTPIEKPTFLETLSRYEIYFSKWNFWSFLLCCSFPTNRADLWSTLWSRSMLSLAGLTVTWPVSGMWIWREVPRTCCSPWSESFSLVACSSPGVEGCSSSELESESPHSTQAFTTAIRCLKAKTETKHKQEFSEKVGSEIQRYCCCLVLHVHMFFLFMV